MKEREAKALKRKRATEAGDDADEVIANGEKGSKSQKGETDTDASEGRRRERAQKRKEKRVQKKEKNLEKKAKAEAKKAKKQDRDLAQAASETRNSKPAAQRGGDEEDEEEDDAEPMAHPMDDEKIEFPGLEGAEDAHVDGDVGDAASQDSSTPATPLFDTATNHSPSSSSSSIVPPSKIEHQLDIDQSVPKDAGATPQPERTDATFEQPKTQQIEAATKPVDIPSGTSSPKLPKINHEHLQERLAKRIEELRAARKADGADGKPAQSRQELLDQRRKKEEQRKAARKAQRQKEKDDEQRRREEQLRGSGSPLSTDIFSPRSPKPKDQPPNNNFSFSRLAFEDGTSADPTLSTLHDPRTKKGPSDPRTALQAANNKTSRLAALDTAQQASIADKDMWLNARRRAHGERPKDDTSLLKKALKRKEKMKSKSERDWTEREQGVVKGREMKQKKRERNLEKRREEKGKKGGKGGSGAGKKGGSGGANGGIKKKGRPGFEGRFKA